MPNCGPLKAFRSKRLAETRVVFAFVIGPISIPQENLEHKAQGARGLRDVNFLAPTTCPCLRVRSQELLSFTIHQNWLWRGEA